MHALGLFAQEMLALYGMLIVGYAARKLGVLSSAANQVITQLVLYITLPALILFAMDTAFSVDLVVDMVILIVLSVYILLLACVIARWVRKRFYIPKQQENVVEGLIIFGNQGFLGYAVAFILFADTGIMYATMFNIVYLILIWTYGVYLFVRSAERIAWRQVFVNPGIAAVIIGLIIFFAPFHWPLAASRLLEDVGKMTIPLSMILLGSLLVSVRYDKVITLLKTKMVWKITFLKLILLPLLVIPVFFLPVSFSFPLICVAVLTTGMPSASTISLYAKKYGGDEEFSSFVVCITTLAAFVTIPLLYTVLQWIYL
ncbi:hypothetical protein SAMN05192534_101392 [Alteribacillus persepolensis]|uniref:Auxin efflux carrier n=1 Tax=Alteribacillus persepolensis TaxID=568899 RepID=A0A1G7Z3S2_9BACI|nr:AEC family transporter [Alteribacillus persepolensis]SDH03373.1 hypothetical protein SAMN05192534_101392 [Alteribacillus persepolensis]